MSAEPRVEDPGDERIYGWKAIAGELEVSRRVVERLADPWRKFRLPVRRDHKGIYLRRADMERFVRDNDVPWGIEKPERKKPGANGAAGATG